MQISCFSLVTFITTSSNLNKKNVFTEINDNYIMQNLFLVNCWLSCIDRFATENPVRRKKAKLINWAHELAPHFVSASVRERGKD